MASSAQDLRRRHLLSQQENVARIEGRLDDRRKTLDAAIQAHNAAKAVMEELKLEIEDIEAEHSLARGQMQMVRDAYLRELMIKLPDDILRQIFEKCMPPRANVDIASKEPGLFGSFNRERSDRVSPFAVGRVCKRWRRAALDFRAFWSTIVVRTASQRQLELVRLQLERSEKSPLNIYYYPCGQVDAEAGRAIIDALQEHTWRWQQVQQAYTQPSFELRPEQLSIIQRPAPQLLRLYLHIQANTLTAGLDLQKHRLQVGPQIQQLILLSPWPLAPKPVTVYPCLVSLMWHQPGLEYAWDIIIAARDTLKEVALAPRSTSSFATPPPARSNVALPIVMRSLEQLHILTSNWNAASYLLMLKTPKLHTLTLPSTIHSSTTVQPFFEDVSASVTTLILHKTPLPDSLDALSKLSAVERVMFSTETALFRVDYEVSDAFFARLALRRTVPGSAAAWIWPKLTSVALSSRGSYAAESGEGLLEFVRSRTEPGQDDRSTPRRITDVVLEDRSSPPWLRDEIKRMLAE
ncbi:hypothetical protein AURDEDRAFT_170941 [Auricularia subglabra TFB-10046 SS5]|nr:hypothetical protein AURDEDRAFT_170941 [Auricularia subglabra TFB-10046 SS5]